MIESYCLTPNETTPLPAIPGIRRHVVPCTPYCSAALLYICNARNECVKKFLAGTADFLLFVDSDIEFRGHKIVGGNVLEALDYQCAQSKLDGSVIGGKYRMSGSDHACAVDDLGKYVSLSDGGIGHVAWTGAGWMLIPRNALVAESAPWFRLMVGQTNCPEEVGFCMAARKAGFEIVLDCDINLRHNTKTPQKGTAMLDGNTEQKIDFNSIEAQHGRLLAAEGNIVRALLDELKKQGAIISQLRAELHKSPETETTLERT